MPLDLDNNEGGYGGVNPYGASNPSAPNVDPRILRSLGGPGVDPAFGLAMIQHPELVAAHLASKGVPPPDDIPEGVTHVDAGVSLGKALQPIEQATPSQQGAAESPPLPTPRPTPSPESANASGAVPEADTSANPSTAKSKAGSGGLDDLGKALAGLSPMKGIEQTHVSTPQAYHPSNMISRSNLPSVLLQQLSGITKGTTGPYRLGQALQGIRNA